MEVVVGANQTETQPNQCADEQRMEDAVATEIPAKQEELALVQPTPPEEPAPKREDPTPPEDPKPKEATTDDAKAEVVKVEEPNKLETSKEDNSTQEAAGGNAIAIAAAAEGHEQPADGATEQKVERVVKRWKRLREWVAAGDVNLMLWPLIKVSFTACCG